MSPSITTSRFAVWLLVGLTVFAGVERATAATILLDDGRVLVGKLGQTSGVADDPFQPGPSAGAIRTTPILIIDDGLRRTYLHKTAIREVLDKADVPMIRIPVWQNHAERGSSIGVVGQPLRVTSFDEFGRRIYELPTARGPIAVVQGVTEITPVYTRVRGLRADPKSYIWDQRVATSSLPRETLARILKNTVPPNDLDARLQVVRLYLQSKRYRDARRELEQVQTDFAGRADTEKDGFKDDINQLRQLAAESLLDEIELRRSAGQHQLVRTLLERFPADGVAGDTLQKIRELLDEDDDRQVERHDALKRLATVASKLNEPASRKAAERIVAEITQRLSGATRDRLTAFRQLAQGDALEPEELTALALSGWLMGTNRAMDNLPVALSLIGVRDNVRKYLAESDPAVRESLYLAIRDAEGATVQRVADLLRLMEPPLGLPAEAEIGPRCYALTAGQGGVAKGGGALRYRVQLPPEYDPLRSYPVIVTLPPIGGSTEGALNAQLDYWAGTPTADFGRAGQAMRQGYIVVAIEWSGPNQLGYGYTAREHSAVLVALRDAMRRLAIDSDRVYLTGHGEGGDLAWDVALAHPDAWAGVLPMLATADRYCGWYWQNGQHVPWRLVNGELDAGKVARNAREFDRYLRPRFDTTVIEYRGRGYEPFSDEIQRAFDWMGRKRRGSPPEEFECATMRPWDNYFWWVEVEGLPEKSIVTPAAWPPKRGVRAAKVRGRKYAGNKLGVFARVDKVTVWLSPELIDFAEPIEIEWNGKRLTERGAVIGPDLRVLLEDARTRADRRRPYWAKVESR